MESWLESNSPCGSLVKIGKELFFFHVFTELDVACGDLHPPALKAWLTSPCSRCFPRQNLKPKTGENSGFVVVTIVVLNQNRNFNHLQSFLQPWVDASSQGYHYHQACWRGEVGISRWLLMLLRASPHVHPDEQIWWTEFLAKFIRRLFADPCFDSRLNLFETFWNRHMLKFDLV